MSHLDKLYNCIKIIISSTQRIACERKWRFFGRREIGADRRAIHAHGYRWFNHPNQQRQPPSQWNCLVHRNSTSIGTHSREGEAPERHRHGQAIMGQNQVILRHQKFTFPRVSGATERVNGRVSGPVLTSRFISVLNHSGMARHAWCQFGSCK